MLSSEACRMGCSMHCCGAARCREGQPGQMDLIQKGKFYLPLIKRVNEKEGKGRKAGVGRKKKREQRERKERGVEEK